MKIAVEDKDEQWIKNGQIIHDRYLVISKIGSGAYAQIYKALDKYREDKLIAIKVIKIHSTNYENQKKNLDLEKDAFAKVSFSENVVGLRGFSNWNNMFYMVIDLVEGGMNFANKFKYFNNILTLDEIIYYFKQIANGMIEIHNVGIVHRDIKPQNIMITQDEIVKIADFGISKIQGILSDDKIRNTSFEGTPKFSSPEQYIEPSSYKQQSDIYSMGIMLYEFATGIPTFTQFKEFNKDSEKYKYILLQHIQKEIVRPRVYNPNIPQSLDNIIMKALAKDVKNRYQNFNDFLDDITHVYENKHERPLEILNISKDKKIKKSLKKSNEKKYNIFFSKFNYKFMTTFIIIFSAFFITMIILIFIG